MSNQSTALIDENDKPTLLAYNETTSAPEAMRVDAVFDALEIYGTGTSSANPSAINRALIDENDNPTLLAYNETTGLVESVRCTDEGYLLVLPV